MSAIQHACINLLEDGTTTLALGTAATGYPFTRVYDRHPKREFRTTGNGWMQLHVDQGSGTLQTVDAVVLGWNNCWWVDWYASYSDDDVTFYDVSWSGTPFSGDADFGGVKIFTPIAKRYWRISAYTTQPDWHYEIGEIFLTKVETWARNPSRPTGDLERVFNVVAETTAAGGDRFLVMGDSKRQRNYQLPLIGETQKLQLASLNVNWAGSKPFWLCDHDGTWIYGRLTSPVSIREIGYQQYSAVFSFLEVIG